MDARIISVTKRSESECDSNLAFANYLTAITPALLYLYKFNNLAVAVFVSFSTFA
jgi:hypothetical protein